MEGQSAVAFEDEGARFEIAFVFSAYNGREVGEWPNAPYQFSDGMTVVYCENGHIHDNTFIDNTDFDLLFGGGPNCSVHHTRSITRSGLHLVDSMSAT